MKLERYAREEALQIARRLSFQEFPNPRVSIIIPFYNHLTLTVECLAAIARHPQQTSFEVLLIDDGSTDENSAILSAIPGTQYFRNPENLGYLLSCNSALPHAKGHYVYFLNNDTQVQREWLDPLVDRLESDATVGIAGSMLLFADGRLQEAGARLVRSAGTSEAALIGELIGLGADPTDPCYSFAREVEYCSGASLLVRREILDAAGGLDSSYAPAYFEDADLAYRVRSLGYRVFYEPRSKVMHHLSVSTGNNSPQKMQLISRNAMLFRRKWAAKLDHKDRIRLIAFYLPQYHPIPENDAWWGKGFTEWTNVAKARPNFDGHYQPHLPGELGFYDLRLPEIRKQQAELASEYGVNGFCYYYYWFAGKRLLHRPLDEVIASGEPDFPFCICWANENWTRTWDGNESQILMAQHHSREDDVALIQGLLPALADKRYIRINGRPLVLVYKVGLLPNPQLTAEVWREQCRTAGIGEIYLACVHNNSNPELNVAPSTIGFDAAVEFPPSGRGVPTDTPRNLVNGDFRGLCYDYEATAENMAVSPCPPFTLFRGVMPSWDNTARRQDAGHIFLGASPDRYRKWLQASLQWTSRMHVGDERIVFVNAWNEWAEGNHLEPDQRYGRAYLEATRTAMRDYL